MRPLAPDALPVIGALPSCDNVFVNTGHGMLGVTLAPSSAHALADLMTNGASQVLAPFAASRF
jgi:D-amino-acid dehydrogenase